MNLPLEEEESPRTSYAAAGSLAATAEFLVRYQAKSEASLGSSTGGGRSLRISGCGRVEGC